ncbi:hypothetical protein RRG08_056407 [Elysia crispata]|uniref:Uncharacterized protein n=1 Tax=Elysia crispata TaxID=231223 RepID=A0AAE0YZT6_9GAST|nr:hypothetical protein RRG08_056407 [Elysia crispata]
MPFVYEGSYSYHDKAIISALEILSQIAINVREELVQNPHQHKTRKLQSSEVPELRNQWESGPAAQWELGPAAQWDSTLKLLPNKFEPPGGVTTGPRVDLTTPGL